MQVSDEELFIPQEVLDPTEVQVGRSVLLACPSPAPNSTKRELQLYAPPPLTVQQ